MTERSGAATLDRPSRLVVIGCGPKAAAIAAKARVLRKLGWGVPEVVAIEAAGPASSWDGSNGYTDGRIALGTSVLEDVGFPYRSSLGPDVDRLMLEYSYMAYRIERGDYAEWVDRGLVAPTHGMLASYIKWVVKKAELVVIAATVKRVRSEAGSWVVEYETGSRTDEVVADGVVVTGVGEPLKSVRRGLRPEDEARVLDGRSFWASARSFADMSDARIAVVGGGETSAAIATYLADVVDQSSRIDVVTRHPLIFTRSEHWFEVMYFSTAEGWSRLSDQQKVEVIRHTDRGTFSLAAKQALDRAYNVGIQVGALLCIEANGGDLRVVLAGHDGERTVAYDYIIEATGFDPTSFLDLLEERSTVGDVATLIDRIDFDLSVDGSRPKLHLPGLAAMSQGPGFPNLSCLGLMADRVLGPYLESSRRAGT